jgi:hypothetical protein
MKTELLIALLVSTFGVVLFVLTTLYFYGKNQKKEDKLIERGLKMESFLIHLPPPSDDTDGNGRDTRDLLDENISKSQALYNIISSSYVKGKKMKYYGQKHFAFEIIAHGGFVYFYVAIPHSLVDIVHQGIISAYPAARIERSEEHNIFSQVGKISGCLGGELILKENHAYPIATYIDTKRDAMGSILNSLSILDKTDGASIQFLIRPADPGWRKKALSLAANKRKGKVSKKGLDNFGWWITQIFAAPFKPPEDKSDKKDEPKPLSGDEQSLVDSIESKVQYAGFEVLVRLTASSNLTNKAQTIMNNMVASFSLFDQPGKNGFKYKPVKDTNEHIMNYLLRTFPPDENKNILNSIEMSSLFHFPDYRSMPTSQLERQSSKQVDGPRNVSDKGIVMGYNVFRGAKKRINLDPEDRRRHVYMVGQTGTGKSTMLENMCLQDMMSGNGFAFIDPHGDTAEKLLSMVPKERAEDVYYFCPADMDYPMGLNLFEFNDPDQKDFLIQETMNMLYKLYDPQRQGIIGPRYEHLFRNAALTIMSDPAGGTFIDIPKLFNDSEYVKQKLVHVTDETVRDFWLKEIPQSQRSNEFGEVKSWFVSKFGAFLSNQMMRNIIGQTKSSFNMREIMDNKKILLVNLSKGRTGELNSKLLGMIFVMKFQAAAMSRANIPEDDRIDFSLYVDEFQNFSTDSFATILSEARKYRLNLIVANQFTSQLTEEIRDAVFGNVGTILTCRVGTNDAEFLAKYFSPTFDMDDLQRLPNFNCVARIMINGVPSQPFSMAGLPPLGQPNKELGAALRQLSATKYGRTRKDVEEEIFARIKTVEKTDANTPVPQQVAQQTTKPANFFDDWVNKRATNNFKAPSNPFNKPTAPPQTVPQVPGASPIQDRPMQ